MILINELDFARWGQIGFQDPATPIMEGMIDLHHNILFFLILILFFVLIILFRILERFHYNWEYPISKEILNDRKNILIYLKLIHNTWLEIIWTIIPSIILVLIAIPSFALLYSLDEVIDPTITIKIIGHQWYWSYEYSDYQQLGDINYDSYMIPEKELNLGDLRLLEVDNALVVPINTHIRLIITSTDVLHSRAVPSLGIKVDAVPGRLNQISLYIKRIGTYYGQCSEICGVNHAFMPITVQAVKLTNYLNWLTIAR